MEKTKLDKEIENNSQTMEEVNLMLNKGNFSNGILNKMRNEYNFKILFLGDSKVGKSSIINTILSDAPLNFQNENNFNSNNQYIKTLGCDTRKKKFK